MTTWARYFDERIETMPPAWTRRLEEEGLAQQVARCYERAPFYREKLDGAGVRPTDFSHLEDLARLPFTTKEELRASQAENPPYGGLSACEARSSSFVVNGSRARSSRCRMSAGRTPALSSFSR